MTKNTQALRAFAMTFCMLVLLLPITLKTSAARKGGTFTVGKNTFLLNGKPFLIKAAEMHYPRIPRPYWEQRIKMCKALGMNTICLYVFWNIHETEEGKFDFTGNNDVAAFCRLAQKNGMYVIVRPGPYVCAEWEMGGLPWWLLKKKDVQLRTLDPFFIEHVRKFEQEVGKQLPPLTIQRGGPIIMVQVENEYGAYGEDKNYIRAIRDIVKEAGFKDVTLFQCDWASTFTINGLDDLVWTMNFGTGADIDAQFKRLGELRPDAPKMCSEFWSGWFDKWGARHETRPAKTMVEGIDEMLSKGISFSLYMTHGGTSFGHWAGANSPGIQPDVTSYDYDAPINEYGHATPKYWQLRKTLEKYNGGKKLPEVPKPAAPIITIPKFTLEEFAPLQDGVTATRKKVDDLTFEDANMGWGSMIYTHTLPEVPVPFTLNVNDAHDFAQVFVNDQYIGKIDRVRNEKSIAMPAVKKGDQLTIIIEAMGRINFGEAIKDYKGITRDVTLQADIDGNAVTWTLNKWDEELIPDDYAHVREAFTKGNTPNRFGKRGYYRGYFTLNKVGDTFLNFETWGKGQVYVNGHPLGRIWSIGPQQTLYMPGCWLKKGRNEIIVQDITGPKDAIVWGQDHPELDKLQLEKTNKHNNPGDRPDLNSAKPIAKGMFASGAGWQTIRLGQPAKGRYLALQCNNNQDGGTVSAIAELYLQDTQGKRINRDTWVAKYADSEQGNHSADKAFDLQESTYWQTEDGTECPHLIVIDLGKEQTVSALEYLPREGASVPHSIKDFKLYMW